MDERPELHTVPRQQKQELPNLTPEQQQNVIDELFKFKCIVADQVATIRDLVTQIEQLKANK